MCLFAAAWLRIALGDGRGLVQIFRKDAETLTQATARKDGAPYQLWQPEAIARKDLLILLARLWSSSLNLLDVGWQSYHPPRGVQSPSGWCSGPHQIAAEGGFHSAGGCHCHVRTLKMDADIGTRKPTDGQKIGKVSIRWVEEEQMMTMMIIAVMGDAWWCIRMTIACPVHGE